MRGLLLFGFWMLLIGTAPVDLAVGAVAAALAAWASVRLLPPRALGFRVGGAVRLALRFVRQSFGAGFDVARRALDPGLPLRPGFVAYPVGIPAGAARELFGAVTSLLPGTLPVGADENDALVYHCLDVGLDVVGGLAEDEAALRRALRPECVAAPSTPPTASGAPSPNVPTSVGR